MVSIIELPRRLTNTREHAFICKLTEADTAQAEISHVGMAATTAKTTICLSCAEFRLL
jgi:hypothetical protein